jgi:uncharacterized protein (DUF1684 family)
MNRTNNGSANATLALSFLIAASLFGSCSRWQPKPNLDANAYAKEIEAWHAERWASLKSEDGWLTLVGLYWLKEGENKFGSDATNDIVLNKSGAHDGVFVLKDGVVRIETPLKTGFTVDGKPVSSFLLKSDDDGSPTILHLGSLSFQIIKRGDKLGLRVKDKDNPDRLNFQNTQFYPTDLKWRIDAHFDAYNPPRPVAITNVLGMESPETSPGAVIFEVEGHRYRLDAITEKGETKFFMIIADKTSGKETYPAGRYLYVDPPDSSGRMVIDFNKAYSPPCVCLSRLMRGRSTADMRSNR